MDNLDLLLNRDWDPEYLQELFRTDFNDMSELWSDAVSDTEMNKLADKYCPIVEDISMDDEELSHAVKTIELQNNIPQ